MKMVNAFQERDSLKKYNFCNLERITKHSKSRKRLIVISIPHVNNATQHSKKYPNFHIFDDALCQRFEMIRFQQNVT